MPVCFACRVTVIVVLKAEFQMMWRLIDDLYSANSGEKNDGGGYFLGHSSSGKRSIKI